MILKQRGLVVLQSNFEEGYSNSKRNLDVPSKFLVLPGNQTIVDKNHETLVVVSVQVITGFLLIKLYIRLRN